MTTTPLAAVDFGSAVTDGFRDLAMFVPTLLGFLVILLVGYVIASLVSKLVARGLHRVGFNQAAERVGTTRVLSHTRWDASDLVATLVFFVLFLPALSAAVGVLGIAALSAPVAAFILLIPNIVVALVLLILGATLAGMARDVLRSTLRALSYGAGIATAGGALVFVLFAKAALDQVGIAENVTNAVLYTALAIIAGVTIVGVGGGLVRPMQARWEGILDKATDEARVARGQTTAGATPTRATPTAAYPADPYAAPPAYEPTALRGGPRE
jgi:hypothetical protein